MAHGDYERLTPQAIDQVRIFGVHVKWTAELPLLDGAIATLKIDKKQKLTGLSVDGKQLLSANGIFTLTLNAARDNVILLPSHYMANFNGYNWLIGSAPARALDPARWTRGPGPPSCSTS